MRLKTLEKNYKESELYNKKDYGKSKTDKTNFMPNYSDVNSIIGENKNSGIYDTDEESGKIRSVLYNKTLDIAEKMQFAKKTSKEYRKEAEEQYTKEYKGYVEKLESNKNKVENENK